MARKFANNAFSLLAAGIAAIDTSLTVTTGEGARFPAIAAPDTMKATLYDGTNIEIVTITAHTAGADSFTVTRAQEGTAGVAFATGAVFSHRLTSEALTAFEAHINATSAAHAASAISNTPAGNIAATTVQAAINELDTEKQPLNTTLTAISAATLGAFSHRNKIINGGFAVNQRGYVSGTATTAGQYTLDRWKVTGTGGITFSTTANKTTVTIPSGQALQQVIEGLNLQSGTYVMSWEGTAQGKIGAGSLSASGVTGSITGGTDTTIEFGPGTVANVQLEFGSVSTPFEHRPYGTELALCQRYYVRLSSYGMAGFAVSTTEIDIAGSFPVPMRANPTGTMLDGTVFSSLYTLLTAAGWSNTATVTATFQISSVTRFWITITGTAGAWLTAGSPVISNAVGIFAGFSAEL